MNSEISGGSPASKIPNDDVALAKHLCLRLQKLRDEIAKKVVGQDDVIELLLIALLSKGHGLFVGVPGLAKTLLIQTLSEGLGLDFSRIQFTPDLMPSDITGTDVLEEDKSSGTREFRFLKGPIFSNVILADEINRTPPKTQAALLQAMQEREVTAGAKTYNLEAPFLVFATQNPIEQEGTYPLPEAQLDRFMFMIDVGYPTDLEEIEIVRRTTSGNDIKIEAVLDGAEIVSFQSLVRRVPVADHVINYAVRLVRATRPREPSASNFVKEQLQWGAGPRASQNLIVGAKSRALLKGRNVASIEDVKAVAQAVLAHRLVVTFGASSAGVTTKDVVKELIQSVGESA